MPLTEEEKKALKAQKKAQKKLAAEMLKRKIRKDQLNREAALGQRSWGLMKERWRESFLKIKIPHMQEDLLAMEGCIERWMDAKNYQILLLQEERDELHDQSNFVSQCHVAILDKLIELFVQRVNDLRSVYNQDVSLKKAEGETEFEKINKAEDETQENMKAMNFQIEMNRDRDEDVMNCEMFLKVDDEKSKNTERREALKTMLEKKMERRWSQIAGVLMDYQQSTESRRNHFFQLRNKDKLDAKEIFYQMRKTQRLSRQTQELKVKLERAHVPEKTKMLIQDYKDERDKFYHAFKYLRKVLLEERHLDETQLKNLISITTGVVDNLNQYSKLGENVLSLFAICRRFETEKEKVCDVGNSLSEATMPDKIRSEFEVLSGLERSERKNQELDFANEEAKVLKDYMVLIKFWRKVGRADLSRLGLIKSICELEKENAYLKQFLYIYMKHVSNKRRPCIPNV